MFTEREQAARTEHRAYPVGGAGVSTQQLQPFGPGGGRHPIPSVRMDIGRNQAGTLGVQEPWLGPAGVARVVTRGPGGDGVNQDGLTPFLFKEFPGSLAPRWGRTNTNRPWLPHRSSIDTRILLKTMPQMYIQVSQYDFLGQLTRFVRVIVCKIAERSPKVERIEHAGYLRRGRRIRAWVSETRTRDYA